MNKLWSLLFSLVLTLGLCGCELRPLEEVPEGVNINIKVNVKTVANVTTHIYNEKIAVPEIYPDAMHVLFYEKDGDRLISESFITHKQMGNEGECSMTGYVDVLPGTYKMVVYSFGSYYTAVENYNDWSKISARALEVDEVLGNRYKTTMAMGRQTAPVVTHVPDHIVVARNEEETIPDHLDSYTIHAEASTVVDTYYLQVKVDGLQYVSSARAYLSGMASGNILSKNEPIAEPESVLYFKMEKSEDNGEPVICAIFNTFGRLENTTNNLSITFDMVTVDGRNESRTFDITDLFQTELCQKYHWLLLEEKIKIEKPASDDDFTPGVNDWEEDNHQIYL